MKAKMMTVKITSQQPDVRIALKKERLKNVALLLLTLTLTNKYKNKRKESRIRAVVATARNNKKMKTIYTLGEKGPILVRNHTQTALDEIQGVPLVNTKKIAKQTGLSMGKSGEVTQADQMPRINTTKTRKNTERLLEIPFFTTSTKMRKTNQIQTVIVHTVVIVIATLPVRETGSHVIGIIIVGIVIIVKGMLLHEKARLVSFITEITCPKGIFPYREIQPPRSLEVAERRWNYQVDRFLRGF